MRRIVENPSEILLKDCQITMGSFCQLLHGYMLENRFPDNPLERIRKPADTLGQSSLAFVFVMGNQQ